MTGSDNTTRWRLKCIRSATALAAAVCFALALATEPGRAAEETPQALLAQGEYQKAAAAAEAILGRFPDRADAMAALLDAMIATGDYRKAAERGEEFLKRKTDDAVAVRTAQGWSLVGEYARAESKLASFSSPEALWMRGLLSQRKGDRQAARDLFSEAAAQLNAVASGTTKPRLLELAAIADSLAELGKYKDANQVYQLAAKLAAGGPANAGGVPDDAVLKTRWGNLLASKHNPADAEGLYREALKTNPKLAEASIGLAQLAAGNWDGKTATLVEQALAVDPNLAEAHLLLAQVQLEQENYAEAAKQLDAIDRINPRLLESWSMRAASEYLQGHTAALEQQWIPKILAENPNYGELFGELGDFAVIKRQYGQAVDFYRKALDKNPDLDDVRSNLGINVFRLGQEAEARKILEESYTRDPYNIWTVNTLRLMDSLDGYQTFETDKFIVRLNKKEAALLWPYVNDLLEQSYASLTARYGYRPPQKVLIEAFPDHEDFAVRTLGLPGLGALGATFGPVVAMDSPSARPVSEFHWGSTLWHEFGHVITLGMTANKVPRWFTEGLSVYEETHAHPGWGDPMNLATIRDLQQHGLVPIEKLDGVFVRPQYPTQVVFAYFQAGMICDFIADTYGFPKIVAMLKAYADGKNDTDAIHDALGLSPEEFDKAFKEYARVKTYNFGEAIHFDTVDIAGLSPEQNDARGGEGAPRVITPEMASSLDKSHDFLALLREANDLRKASNFTEAIADAEQAKKLFPPYVDEGNPYELLAGIYEEQRQKEKAVEELTAWRIQKGRDPKVFWKLAELQAQLGRRKDAILTLTEALQVSMFDVAIHNRLGELESEEGATRLAVREYRAVLALDPPDKAEAHYNLATAYWKQSDKAAAKREVLAALEIAPGYRPAQQLLLEMDK
jgi:tetratricopeptide (TPR) repeat protein